MPAKDFPKSGRITIHLTKLKKIVARNRIWVTIATIITAGKVSNELIFNFIVYYGSMHTCLRLEMPADIESAGIPHNYLISRKTIPLILDIQNTTLCSILHLLRPQAQISDMLELHLQDS